MGRLINTLFPRLLGCRHRKTTPLITIRPGQPRTGTASLTGTYCVCLSCGKEFAYDWQAMRFLDSREMDSMLKKLASMSQVPDSQPSMGD